MTSTIDTAFQELISKVEESQCLIDDLKMQVERLKLKLESQNKLQGELESQDKLQEELEYYFLLSQNQLEILKENETLQARAVALLASLTS
jgi:hypothetical protein